ncbi:MAG: hypothetical protein ACRYGP_13740 [Janthinobacterium lividum]
MTTETAAAPAPQVAFDNPASRKLSEGVELGLDPHVDVSSGNVFADIGVPNPGVALRLADARLAGLPEPIARALAELVSVAIEAVGEHEPALVAALDGAIATINAAVLPSEITPEIVEVLGLPNFRCGPIADVYRAAGHEIERQSEKEQAFVLFHFLHFVLRHGAGWFAQSCIDLDAAVATAKERSNG